MLHWSACSVAKKHIPCFKLCIFSYGLFIYLGYLVKYSAQWPVDSDSQYWFLNTNRLKLVNIRTLLCLLLSCSATKMLNLSFQTVYYLIIWIIFTSKAISSVIPLLWHCELYLCCPQEVVLKFQPSPACCHLSPAVQERCPWFWISTARPQRTDSGNKIWFLLSERSVLDLVSSGFCL